MQPQSCLWTGSWLSVPSHLGTAVKNGRLRKKLLEPCLGLSAALLLSAHKGSYQGPIWFNALNNKLHSMWGISKMKQRKTVPAMAFLVASTKQGQGKESELSSWPLWYCHIGKPPNRPDSMASQSSQPPSPLVGSSWEPTVIEKPGRTARWMHPRHQNS